VAVLSPLLLFGRALALGLGILKAIPRALGRSPLGDTADATSKGTAP
jgi:hypothetical protein